MTCNFYDFHMPINNLDNTSNNSLANNEQDRRIIKIRQTHKCYATTHRDVVKEYNLHKGVKSHRYNLYKRLTGLAVLNDQTLNFTSLTLTVINNLPSQSDS